MSSKIFTAILLSVWLVGALAGCLPVSTPLPPEPTNTPLPPTLTPTATTVWFPPTPTNTPLPTPTLPVTPTVSLSMPQYGQSILSDDFSDPAPWTLGRSPAGSAALGKGELTLAVSQPKGYLYSLRPQAYLKDFYLEITASPSICRGGDEYGVLLRVSPSLDFYRFSLTCDGRARLDRVVNGKASSPQPPVPSGSIPPGAPSQSRLAVEAIGNQFRLFANEELLFVVRDPMLVSGALGVFARAAGEDAVTVNFSDLQVYEAAK